MGKIKQYFRVVLVVLVITAVGCASTYCRPKQEVQTSADLEFDDSEAISHERVFVFKPDGSLQCGMGQAIDMERMKDQLGDIEVFSSDNRHDGLMRAQVCGQATGQVNIYEIRKSDQPKAESLGFKLFERN